MPRACWRASGAWSQAASRSTAASRLAAAAAEPRATVPIAWQQATATATARTASRRSTTVSTVTTASRRSTTAPEARPRPACSVRRRSPQRSRRQRRSAGRGDDGVPCREHSHFSKRASNSQRAPHFWPFRSRSDVPLGRAARTCRADLPFGRAARDGPRLSASTRSSSWDRAAPTSARARRVHR